jgi:hypothetical protein
MGDPAGIAEEAPNPPRGKQVPAAEIHGLSPKTTIYAKTAFEIRGTNNIRVN